MPGAWKKTLVYLGLVEDDDLDDYGYAEDGEPEAAPRRRSARPVEDAAAGGGAPPGRGAVVRAMPTPGAAARFHLVLPRSFNDVQEVGDKYREGFSVIMNLQAVDPELARRLVDFASGLAYGLGGSMQPVAEKVFLLTPAGVQVSAEERRRLLEERGFFNQA
jgi:cell division inhibitor SepF